MYLIVRDIKKAQEKLQTNRPIKIGEKIEGSFEQLTLIFDEEAFEKVETVKKEEQKPEQKDKEIAPSKDKKLKKTNKFKSK